MASLDEFCFSGNPPHNLYCFVYNFQSFCLVNDDDDDHDHHDHDDHDA